MTRENMKYSPKKKKKCLFPGKIKQNASFAVYRLISRKKNKKIKKSRCNPLGSILSTEVEVFQTRNAKL